MMLCDFAGVRLRLLPGWGDVTGEGEPPTLVKSGGVGALQFSVAKYVEGQRPVFTEGSLKQMLREFCATHGLVPLGPITAPVQNGISAAAIAEGGGDRVAVWYISNGCDVALVTYMASGRLMQKNEDEFAEAAAIVHSVQLL